MKNILKTILKPTIICLLLALTACEKDLYDDAIDHNKKDFKYGTVSFSQVKHLNPVVATTIDRVTSTMAAASKTTIDLYGFEVDTTKINYIEKTDGFKSFSLKIEQGQGLYYFRNLVLSQFPDGRLDVRIVKFNLSKPFEQVQSDEKVKESVVSEEVSRYNTANNTVNFYSCIEVGYYAMVSACDGDNQGYYECYDENGNERMVEVFIIIDQECSFGGGGGWAGSDGGYSEGDLNDGSTGGITGSNEIFIPNILVDTESQAPGVLPLGWRIQYFEESLEESQLTIYNAYPELREYLASNNCKPESCTFVEDIISTIDNYQNDYGESSVTDEIINDFVNSVVNDDVNANANGDVGAAPDCSGFNFTNTGSNWQSAAVKNINFTTVVLDPNGMHVNLVILYQQPILFEAPRTLQVGGTNISPGAAASMAAYALLISMKETVAKYGNKNVSEMMVKMYFEERLKHNFPMILPGARVNTHPQNYTVSPTQYQTNASNMSVGNCD